MADHLAGWWDALEKLLPKMPKVAPGVSIVVDHLDAFVLFPEIPLQLVVALGRELHDICEGLYLGKELVFEIWHGAWGEHP
jgi:hypothetical protein